MSERNTIMEDDELQEISERIDEINKEIGGVLEERDALCAEYDYIQTLNRPLYPTQEHCEGIAQAVEAIRENLKPKSHHGDPCGPDSNPYCVKVNGRTGLLQVLTQAPMSRVAKGRCLWGFTDHQVSATLALVEESGLSVTKSWRSSGGLSIEAKLV